MATLTALSQARELLESGGDFARTPLSEAIAGSWHRCREMGLDPRGAPVDGVLSHQDLRARCEEREALLAIVRPELELLSTQIAGTNFMCAFADETGVVLDAILDHEFEQSVCARSVRPGSIWREDLRGTNALGLALYCGRSSIVTGGEHYFGCHSAVSCVSTPIFASDGSIAGLLDASSQVAERQLHTAALVRLAATNIENRLFAEDHKADFIVQFHPREEYLPTQSVGMIALDEAGRITGANRASTRLVPVLGASGNRRFGDLFRGDFHAVLQRLALGEVVRLQEWMNSVVFARMRPGSRAWAEVPPVPVTGAGTWAALRSRRPGAKRVWDDDMIRDSLRTACKAAKLGQPVCVRGAPGTGKTALAEAVHRDRHPEKPMIAIDCRTLKGGGLMQALQVAAAPSGAIPDLGGTVVLECHAALDRHPATAQAILRDELRTLLEGGLWSVIGTGAAGDQHGDRVTTMAGLKGLVVDLPALADRTDFDKIARAMLADLSPDHQLSTTALKALAGIERPDNLNDLRHQLQLLAVSHPAGVLRETHVQRTFPEAQSLPRACPRCEGSDFRRQRCLEIRRVYRACQGNVALTARRLGVSRNTVYAHLGD